MHASPAAGGLIFALPVVELSGKILWILLFKDGIFGVLTFSRQMFIIVPLLQCVGIIMHLNFSGRGFYSQDKRAETLTIDQVLSLENRT